MIIADPKMYNLLVGEFCKTFNHRTFEKIETVPHNVLKLCTGLIEEESAEYHKEKERGVDELDGICDLLYVVFFLTNVGNIPVQPYRTGQLPLILCPKQYLYQEVLDVTQELHTMFPCQRRLNPAIDKLVKRLIDTARLRGYDLPGAFVAVHKNNMDKLWSEASTDPAHTNTPKGKKWLVHNKNGKTVKPVGHKKVDLRKFL